MSEPLLVAEGIHKSYPMGGARLHVLRGCSLRVRAGEFVAIMGKSGSGKSTLLHILGALDRPDQGEVFLAGRPVFSPRSLPSRLAIGADRVLAGSGQVLAGILKLLLVLVLVALPLFLLIFPALLLYRPGALPTALYLLAATLGLLAVCLILLVGALLARLVLASIIENPRVYLRRRELGFVFQFYHLLPELNVLDNVLLPRRVAASTLGWVRERRPARQAALDVLARVGLSERLRHRPSELSGGECQRVAIARALVHRPKILLADEPTGNLDAEAGAALMALLKRLHQDGQTIIMVTHDPTVAAHADRILRLEDGVLRPV